MHHVWVLIFKGFLQLWAGHSSQIIFDYSQAGYIELYCWGSGQLVPSSMSFGNPLLGALLFPSQDEWAVPGSWGLLESVIGGAPVGAGCWEEGADNILC